MLEKNKERELEQQILSLTDSLIENIANIDLETDENQENQLNHAASIVVEMLEHVEEYLGGHTEHLGELIEQLTKQKMPDSELMDQLEKFEENLDMAITLGLNNYQSTARHHDDVVIQENVGGNEDIEIVEMESSPIETDFTDEEEGPSLASGDEEPYEEYDESEPQMVMQSEEICVGEEPITKEAEDTDVEGVLTREIKGRAKVNETWIFALQNIFPGEIVAQDYELNKIKFSYYLPNLALAVDEPPACVKDKIWKEYFCKQNNISLITINANQDIRPRQLIRKIKRAMAENAIPV